jgi:hypothetical protein
MLPATVVAGSDAIREVNVFARARREQKLRLVEALQERSLLGSASLPATLWLVVFSAAGLSWALAEGISRALWRQKGHP